MEAVGFIISVGQLAATGLTLSKALYEYGSTVSNAPTILSNFAEDVGLTSSVLEHLSEVFTEATMRVFVRPGALHTAQEAIAGCSEISLEMKTLIEEGGRGMGKFSLPFKEAKIQLLNARLASLKSTLQLLLQVSQYASTVNIDPNASQFSLSGTWAIEQFKQLIDEREEAKRNLEQLKAEIGSTKSVMGEPSKSSTIAPTQPLAMEEARDLTIQPAPLFSSHANITSLETPKAKPVALASLGTDTK